MPLRLLSRRAQDQAAMFSEALPTSSTPVHWTDGDVVNGKRAWIVNRYASMIELSFTYYTWHPQIESQNVDLNDDHLPANCGGAFIDLRRRIPTLASHVCRTLADQQQHDLLSPALPNAPRLAYVLLLSNTKLVRKNKENCHQRVQNDDV